MSAGVADRLASALAGRYRIERELGAGGMATVFLAHDLRHGRDVAIKVLHPELGAALGSERFLAEIRTTARLQHPHILPLLDSGEADGLLYYVMPYVAGESLRDRLERERQLPVADALRVADEVADALGAAHGHGIVHRDVKPENILLQDGHALVADFGIALAVQQAGGQRMTQTGLSLGTPHYMAPEQAMGEKVIDARADVYALAAVTYEMLTGEPPFTGPTVQAIVAKVMSEPVRPVRVARPSVPEHVDEALQVALEKLPADRYSGVRQFAEALRQEGARPTRGATSRAAATGGRRHGWLVPLLASATLASLLFAAWAYTRGDAERPVTRSYLRFPDAEAPTLDPPSYAIFPDGSAIVYVGPAARGTQVWVKRRAELHATPVGGTEGATATFVSPDGEWIGFSARQKIWKMKVTGGEPVAVADARCASGVCLGEGTFLDDGRVVFAHLADLAITRESGGGAEVLVPSRMISGFAARFPAAVPGRRAVLFTACTIGCRRSDLWVVDVDTRRAERVMENASHPAIAGTGDLVYRDADGRLLAVPFDPQALRPAGTPVTVLEGVAEGASIARDGTLLYAAGVPRAHSDLVLVSRDGTARFVDSTWTGAFTTLALSPDGARIAVSMLESGAEHLWVKSLAGGVPLRLTSGGDQHTSPAWSADGASVRYTRFAPDSNWFEARRADGTGGVQVLQHGRDWVIENVASRDGAWILQREYRRDGRREIYARRATGDTATRLAVRGGGQDVSPALSPDGRWLAYTASDRTPPEVVVVPFPQTERARWLVTSGGSEPTWSPDGTELFFVNDRNELVAATVRAGATFEVSGLRTLFPLAGYRRFPTHRAYEVLPGGSGFLMIRQRGPAVESLVLVDNWFSELRAKVKR